MRQCGGVNPSFKALYSVERVCSIEPGQFVLMVNRGQLFGAVPLQFEILRANPVAEDVPLGLQPATLQPNPEHVAFSRVLQ